MREVYARLSQKMRMTSAIHSDSFALLNKQPVRPIRSAIDDQINSSYRKKFVETKRTKKADASDVQEHRVRRPDDPALNR